MPSTHSIIDTTLNFFFILSSIYYFSYIIIHSILSLASLVLTFIYYATQNKYEDLTLSDAELPAVSVLVPAYNEGELIKQTLTYLLKIEYPNYKIVVINDGSTDNTLEVLKEAFELQPVPFVKHSDHLIHQPVTAVYESALEPNLMVIDKVNGRKADALNAGLSIITSPYFICIDADSYVAPYAIRKAIKHFLFDKHVHGLGCALRIMENMEQTATGKMEGDISLKPIYAFQTIEYIRAFTLYRMAWSGINAIPLISGAFSMYKTKTALDAGGYRPSSIGDDSDMTLNLHEYLSTKTSEPYKLIYIPEPLCWTQVPADWKSLFNQRVRWQRGSMEGIYYRFIYFLKFKNLGLSLGSIPFTIIFTHICRPLQIFAFVVFCVGLLHSQTPPLLTLFAMVMLGMYWVFNTLLAFLVDCITYKSYRSWWNPFVFLLYSMVKPLVYSPFVTLAYLKGFFKELLRQQHTHGSMKRINIHSVAKLSQ